MGKTFFRMNRIMYDVHRISYVCKYLNHCSSYNHPPAKTPITLIGYVLALYLPFIKMTIIPVSCKSTAACHYIWKARHKETSKNDQ